MKTIVRLAARVTRCVLWVMSYSIVAAGASLLAAAAIEMIGLRSYIDLLAVNSHRGGFWFLIVPQGLEAVPIFVPFLVILFVREFNILGGLFRLAMGLVGYDAVWVLFAWSFGGGRVEDILAMVVYCFPYVAFIMLGIAWTLIRRIGLQRT